MTIKQRLNSLLEDISAAANLPISRDQAIEMGQDKFLYLENAPAYGGYRLVNVGVKNGGHYGAFGGNGCEARLKCKEMITKLEGILAGLNAAK